jgi:two-component system cell cycle response regulator DivK
VLVWTRAVDGIPDSEEGEANWADLSRNGLFRRIGVHSYQLLKCPALEHQRAIAANRRTAGPRFGAVFGEREGQATMTLETMMQNGNIDGPVPKKVLIVEDNELNMKLFNDLLEAHGYTTLRTTDGRDALAIARLHRPDLILMDIQLPEVSGLEITKWLKGDEELRDIPVIAVTALAMPGDEEKIRRGGCEGYIAKPIAIAGFLQVVERYSSVTVLAGS